MGNYWKRNVNTVFIMQGNNCNMDCVYCLQHPLAQNPLSKEINPEIYDFFSELANENEKGSIHLQFYGGEPLLYFPVTKCVVEEMGKRNIPGTYSIICNGRALTDEMVDFFNRHNFFVTISWDGYHTKKTRRFDVFSIPEIKKRILQLKKLGLSGVISAKVYPLEMLDAFQDICDDYETIHRHRIEVNVDEVFDTGLCDKSILGVDYARVIHDMRLLTKIYLSALLSGKSELNDYTKLLYMDGIFRKIKKFYLIKNGEWDKATAYCGNGLSVLNIDLDGNLYPCHNVSQKIGDIYTPFFIYLERLLLGDNTIHRRERCISCPVLSCCKGGCKLLDTPVLNETYCKLKKAMFMPVIEEIEKRGVLLLDKNLHT